MHAFLITFWTADAIGDPKSARVDAANADDARSTAFRTLSAIAIVSTYQL